MRFTQTIADGIKPNPEKKQWLHDDVIKGLTLYIGKTGIKVWYYYFRDVNGKKASRKLGDAQVLTLSQARQMVKDFGGKVARGENIRKEKPTDKLTLGSFLDEIYFPTIRRTLKSHQETTRKITANFSQFFDKAIDDLSPIAFEKWRTARLEARLKAATVNKILSALLSATNWGVKRDLIDRNPLQRLGKLPEDDSKKIDRYLKPDERERLEKTLIEREERLRRETGSCIGEVFFDFLRPCVLLALNTGIRQGTLTSLVWSDVDFDDQTLLLRAEISKNRKNIRINLNDDAIYILSAWHQQSPYKSPDALIFSSPKTGGKLEPVDTNKVLQR